MLGVEEEAGDAGEGCDSRALGDVGGEGRHGGHALLWPVDSSDRIEAVAFDKKIRSPTSRRPQR